VTSLLGHRAALPAGGGLRHMLGYLVALLLRHRGTLLLPVASIMAHIGVDSGALVLVDCLVCGLHSGAALCVLHGGAELPVRCLVRWLALGGVARGALCLYLCGVGGL